MFAVSKILICLEGITTMTGKSPLLFQIAIELNQSLTTSPCISLLYPLGLHNNLDVFPLHNMLTKHISCDYHIYIANNNGLYSSNKNHALPNKLYPG